MEDLKSENWISTKHPRIFYKEKGDRWNRGEFRISKQFASAFPEFKILITMGPHRFYDIGYKTDIDNKIIHLDFYSVRLPTKTMVESCISEIKDFLERNKEGV